MTAAGPAPEGSGNSAKSASAAETADAALGVVQDVVAPTSPEPVADSAVAVDVSKVTPDRPTTTPVGTAVLFVSAGLGLVLLTTWVVHLGTKVPGIDESIHRWVVEHRSPASITFARFVTHGGVTSLVLPALIVVGAVAAKGGRDYWRRLQTGVLVTVVASAGVWVGLQLNAAVGRERPPVADWAGGAGGPSFPSGHTSCATLVALAAAWVIADRVRAGWPRVLVWVGAGLWAFTVGVSRVWLGVHWPTDVLGGWLFGLTWFAGAVTVLALLQRWSRRRRELRAPAQPVADRPAVGVVHEPEQG